MTAMLYDPVRYAETSPLLPLDDTTPGAPIGSDCSLREARRILEEVRVALDRDVAAARHSVAQLATVLDGTARKAPPIGLVRGGLAPWQLGRVREYVALHLAEPLPIEQLSALVRLSASHFTRAFRVSMGMSPHTFIVRQRIEQAKRLIRQTEAPLSEIALSCGLSDQAHLTRLFTRYEGVSPGAWRRLHFESPLSQAA
jgi:AraC family transcriptional regulator